LHDPSMKDKYYTAYEYGMGSVVQIIRARSEREIIAKYPKLVVFHPTAEWIERHHKIREYDVDDPPDEFLAQLTVSDTNN
jgi:hypothetical protein